MRISRRGFLSTLSASATGVRNVTSSIAASLAGFLLSGLRAVRAALSSYPYYLIDTDLGTIRVDTIQQITMGANYTIDVKAKNLRFLKVPTGVLLAVEPGKPQRPYQLTDLLTLQGVDLHLENAGIISGPSKNTYRIVSHLATETLSLSMDVNQWFPKDSIDLLGLEFDDEKGLVLRIGPDIFGVSAPVKAEWPKFNLRVNGSTGVKQLEFRRQDDSLAVQFPRGQVISGKHSLLVFERPDSHVVLNDSDENFHPEQLTWTPRTGHLVLSSTQQHVSIDPPRLAVICNLKIDQTNATLVTFGVVEGSNVPAFDVSAARPSVQVCLSSFTSPNPIDPLWTLLPPDTPVVIGPYKGSVQGRVREPKIFSDDLLTKNGEIDSVLFTAQRGKSSIWGTEISRIVQQNCRSLAVRFERLGPGGLDDVIVKLDANVCAVLSSDGTGKITADKGNTLIGKYVCVSADQMLGLAAFTSFDVETSQPQVHLKVDSPVVNWTGAAGHSAELEDAWTVQSKLRGDRLPLDGEYRPGEIQVPNIKLQWSYQAGTSRLLKISAGASPAIPTPPRLTALGLSRFRSSLEPTDPVQHFDKCLLVPFSLREHPCEFTITQACATHNPPTDAAAFSEANMWEPNSIVGIEPSSSVADSLDQFPSKTFAGGIAFRNAGLAMAGIISDVASASWAPSDNLPSLAPYKAIRIQSVQSTTSEDLISPCTGACPSSTSNDVLRQGFDDGLGATGTETRIVNASISSPDVAVALSPIGGSISFDWSAQSTANLRSLKLHTYLGRYEYNSASLADMLLPWGLEIELLFRLYRDIDGKMKYIQKWRFVQDEQEYGTTNPVRIYNLRPLNATTWEMGLPFLFQADIDIPFGKKVATKQNVNVQATSVRTAKSIDAETTLPFDDLPDAASPRNMFDETLMRLHTITWKSSPNSNPGSSPGDLLIQTQANGEVVFASNLALDSKAISVVAEGNVVRSTFAWNAVQKVYDPIYQATRATVGSGMLRILPANSAGVELPSNSNSIFKDKPKFASNQVETTSDITAQYQIDRDLDLSDTSFMQLLFPITTPQKLKGKLTLQFSFHYHKQNGGVTLDSQQIVTTCKFPDLSSINDDVCKQAFGSLPVAIHPKSFEADFNETDKSGELTTQYSANMVTDIGVPGLIVFRDSKFSLQNGTTSFNLGKFDLCPGSFLEIALQEILGNLSLFGGDNLSLHVGWDFHGPEIGLSINLLPANMGGGFITNLKFEIRFGLHIDASGRGGGCAFALFFNLGEYSHPDLSFLDWANPNLHISDIAMSMLPQLRPVTLTIDPFVLRFTFILGIRKVDVSGVPEFGICVTGDAGLGVAFDIGVARGGASVTLGARFCPDPKTGLIISVGVSIDAWATVLSIIDVRLHAELFINLYLACAPSFHMIGHLVFSGYASIKIAFVTISASFTVNLDNFLGLCPCPCGNNVQAQLLDQSEWTLSEIERHVDSCVLQFADWYGVAA